ncbi:MAG: hypothetical protein GY844_30820 [Bradyrhizobium sp.]|nr:hypothetical protein [Bradyrhizobium sp.]
MTGASSLPFDEIATVSPETLGMLMLKSDPHAARLDDGAKRLAVSDALADGAAIAGDLRERFPGQSPRRIAAELQVTVTTTDEDPLVGSIWRFAEYRARPPQILLYARGLAPVEHALARAPAARLLGNAVVEDVLIAHELYHHAEATRAELPIARRHQATLFQIGKWRWRTGIPALAEIAAGSFAQALLQLPCHPKVLDFLAGEAIGSKRRVHPGSGVMTLLPGSEIA